MDQCIAARELRACCRPTETGAGPSDARITAAAPHSTGVFLACAWCLELSCILENPIGSVDVGTACCARHRHALRTGVSAPQVRAHCLLACLVSSYSDISATAVQPSSVAHCVIVGVGKPAWKHADCVHPCTMPARLLSLACISLHCHPPIHLPLPLASPKTKTPRSLGDILTD